MDNRVLLAIQLILVTILGPVVTARMDGSIEQVLWSVPLGWGVILSMHVLFNQIDKLSSAPKASERSDDTTKP